jgi:hypothetical protein
MSLGEKCQTANMKTDDSFNKSKVWCKKGLQDPSKEATFLVKFIAKTIVSIPSFSFSSMKFVKGPLWKSQDQWPGSSYIWICLWNLSNDTSIPNMPVDQS